MKKKVKKTNCIVKGFPRLQFKRNLGEGGSLLEMSAAETETVKFSKGDGQYVEVKASTANGSNFDRLYHISLIGENIFITGYPGIHYGGKVVFNSKRNKKSLERINMSTIRFDRKNGVKKTFAAHQILMRSPEVKEISLQEAEKVYREIVYSVKESKS